MIINCIEMDYFESLKIIMWKETKHNPLKIQLSARSIIVSGILFDSHFLTLDSCWLKLMIQKFDIILLISHVIFIHCQLNIYLYKITLNKVQRSAVINICTNLIKSKEVLTCWSLKWTPEMFFRECTYTIHSLGYLQCQISSVIQCGVLPAFDDFSNHSTP